METVFAITLIALGIAATLAIIRATIGPTSFDARIYKRARLFSHCRAHGRA